MKRPFATLALSGLLAVAALPSGAGAASILITNDDGLTSNVRALHDALVAAGHDVIVSVPCEGQSGMSGAMKIGKPMAPLSVDCLNGAASAGDPGAGPMTRAGFEKDYFYVDGTPGMAVLYGIDIAGQKRWGHAPDLVLSGPNQGQNIGWLTLASGTVGAAQLAASRGLPAVALSAGGDTRDDAQLANPKSAQVAALTVTLVDLLERQQGSGPMLPAGIALNVNFPDTPEGAPWRAAKIGTYNTLTMQFVDDLAASASPTMQAYAKAQGHTIPQAPGVTIVYNDAPAKDWQSEDEALLNRSAITVSPMQVGFANIGDAGLWMRDKLGSLFKD